MDRPRPPSLRAQWVIAGAVLAVSATLARVAYTRFPALYDVDAYYHLAVARAYAERGFFQTLDWARFSVMHDAFGDKEFLFHAWLRPFASATDATAGGFTALAILDGLVAATLAYQSMRSIGPWGVAIPFLVFGGSVDFTSRLVRLRPEILSLVLIMVAIELAARRRALLLGLAACVYTLTYTPFHVFLGLCVAFFALGWWTDGRREWRLVVYPAVGVALGLLVHPGFPGNVRVWWIQNVTYFLESAHLDVSGENMSRTTSDALLLNLGWLAGMLALWRARVRRSTPSGDTRLRDFTLLPTVVFGVLYVARARFVTYFVPLATLSVLRTMAAAGEAPGPTVRIASRSVPFAVAFSVCLLWGVYALPMIFKRMEAVALNAFRPGAREDWEAFARAVPDGAKIFAGWQATEQFVFWAPRAVYINVLDSVFMYAKSPELYRAYLDVLQGREPDIPFVARSRFDSEFFADDGQYPLARGRLLNDPRVKKLHDGNTCLFDFTGASNERFVVDWKLLPPTVPLPPPAEVVLDPQIPSYPRATAARDRAIEGYVDGRRLGNASGCLAFAHVEDVVEPNRANLEVSPYGSADIYVDDALVAAIPSPRLAVLGNGVIIPLALDPGRHRITVRTCPSGDAVGFYALER